MNLSDLFAAVAHKELVAVDLPAKGSNQHELNGTEALRRIFGTDQRQSGSIDWTYYRDGADPDRSAGTFTFYDARAASAARTGRREWRLYYTGSFLDRAQPGDLLILARTRDGQLVGMCFARSSSWYRIATSLFGIEEIRHTPTLLDRELDSEAVDLGRRQILDELDLSVPLVVPPTDEELVVNKFGYEFPGTAEMSAFARDNSDVDTSDADASLTGWLEREEQLFRALEKLKIDDQLAEGFRDADHFIDFSLSVQNRRKSRMGHSLQHHLRELFTLRGLKFTAQGRTERGNQPDFLFPGEAEYHDPQYPDQLLRMLAAKSSLKDRWRQVLAEADRIWPKHLCTLEPRLSETQGIDITARQVVLVVPASLHASYTRAQRATLVTIEAFIDSVQELQEVE